MHDDKVEPHSKKSKLITPKLRIFVGRGLK